MTTSNLHLLLLWEDVVRQTDSLKVLLSGMPLFLKGSQRQELTCCNQ